MKKPDEIGFVSKSQHWVRSNKKFDAEIRLVFKKVTSQQVHDIADRLRVLFDKEGDK